MSAVNVMIVDDNPVVCRVLKQIISEDASVCVVGTASNGREALDRIHALKPHVLILDIEMPVMDGLETLDELQDDHPEISVIIFSSHTERGAAATLQAVLRGASDYVCKPSGGIDVVGQMVRTILLPKVKALTAASEYTAKTPPESTWTSNTDAHNSPAAHEHNVSDAPEMLLIGSSAGGPAALNQLLPALEATFPLPVLIVQHMPSMFTRLFAQRLDNDCALEIREAQDGDTVRPGLVLIAPGDYHMELDRFNSVYQVKLNQGPLENHCRPSVDPLFRSASRLLGSRLLALVLTGMGRDGYKGCRAIREAGGQILVQDRNSSLVWGMPGSVAKAGLADEVLSLDEIPKFIMANENDQHT